MTVHIYSLAEIPLSTEKVGKLPTFTQTKFKGILLNC